MKTISNTENICRKAFQRMWIIHRLKELRCPIPELLDILRQQILSIAEQAVPHWGPMITKKESQMIERILKTGLHVIFQSEYKSFQNALKLAHMKSLASRRKDLIFKFSQKIEKSENFNQWLKKSEKGKNTRQKVPTYKPVTTRTTRFERTALPVLTKALAWHPPLIYISQNIN